jgi:hypothetical protein
VNRYKEETRKHNENAICHHAGGPPSPWKKMTEAVCFSVGSMVYVLPRERPCSLDIFCEERVSGGGKITLSQEIRPWRNKWKKRKGNGMIKR